MSDDQTQQEQQRDTDLDYADAHRKLLAAQIDYDDADQSFWETATGVARAVGLTDGLPANAQPSGAISETAELLMGQLRRCADRHFRAAELVPVEDTVELTQRLDEEAAAWIGEGGDEFASYLQQVNYTPQPRASADVKSPRQDSNSLLNEEDFTPLDQVHDAVLTMRDDEVKCFFSTPDAVVQRVVGVARMSLDTLRHMAEQSEEDLPIAHHNISNDDGNGNGSQPRAKAPWQFIGKMSVDVVPLSSQGAYPPFENPEENPFVSNPDELVGNDMRFAIRVRGVELNDGALEFVEEQLAEASDEAAADGGNNGGVVLPPGFFVRYKVPAQLRPTQIETHHSVESGCVRSNMQVFNHVAEWERRAIDDEFLDVLQNSEVIFELVVCTPPQQQTPEAATNKTKASTPQTLRELLQLRANKHADLKRRLEAEILREVTEAANQRDERLKFIEEYRAAFNDDMKHIRRSVDKLRLMLREGIHHKNRGTAKQMTAEHAVELRERHAEVKRRMEDKLYNKTCALNHHRAMEMQNLSSEIHNLKRRKQSTVASCSGAETEALERTSESERVLDEAVQLRDALQKELVEINHIRGDVNIHHTQLRRALFSKDGNSNGNNNNNTSVKSIKGRK